MKFEREEREREKRERERERERESCDNIRYICSVVLEMCICSSSCGFCVSS